MDNISPIREGVVGKAVNKLDSAVKWDNPSIFTGNINKDSEISYDLIYKTLYEDI